MFIAALIFVGLPVMILIGAAVDGYLKADNATRLNRRLRKDERER